MKIELDFVDKIVEKHGSRKTLASILGMYFIATLSLPEGVLWLKALQIGGVVLFGTTTILCQWHLDRVGKKEAILR